MVLRETAFFPQESKCNNDQVHVPFRKIEDHSQLSAALQTLAKRRYCRLFNQIALQVLIPLLRLSFIKPIQNPNSRFLIPLLILCN